MGRPNPDAEKNLPAQYMRFMQQNEHYPNPDAFENPFGPPPPAAPPVARDPTEVDPSTGAPTAQLSDAEFARLVRNAPGGMLRGFGLEQPTTPPPVASNEPAPPAHVVLDPIALNGRPPPAVNVGRAPPVPVDPEAQRRALMSVQPQGTPATSDPMQDPTFRAYIAKQAQDLAELRAAQQQASERRGSTGFRVGSALMAFGGASPDELRARYEHAGQPIADVLERNKMARSSTEDFAAEQKLQGDIRQNAIATQQNDPTSAISRARAMLALHQGLITKDQLPGYTAAMDDALHKGVDSQAKLIQAHAAETSNTFERVVDEQTGETYLVNKRTSERIPLSGNTTPRPEAGPSGPAAHGGASGGTIPPNPAAGTDRAGVPALDTSTPLREPGQTQTNNGPDTRALAAEAYRMTKLPGEVRKQLDDANASIDALTRAQQAVKQYPQAFGLRNNLEELIPGSGGNGIISALTKPVTTSIQAIQQGHRSPEETQARAAVFSEAYRVIHELAGSQVTPLEKARIEQFAPAGTDDATTIFAKIRGALQIAEQTRARIRGQYLPQMAPQRGPATFDASSANPAPQAPSSAGKSKVQQALETNPASLGRYGQILAGAAKQGQQALDAHIYALSQTDPQFQELNRKLAEGNTP